MNFSSSKRWGICIYGWELSFLENRNQNLRIFVLQESAETHSAIQSSGE
jgi:hypothetical protein